jgi:hypothetical protein
MRQIGTIGLTRDAVRVHREFSFDFFKTYAVRIAQTIEIVRILVEMGKISCQISGPDGFRVVEVSPQVREGD